MPEQVLSIVHNLKKGKSFGRWDVYNVAVTDQRCIFALVTGDMAKEAVRLANEQGKAEGKGFFDRWGDQIKISLFYGEKYRTWAPENILSENSANFAIAHSELLKVQFKQKHSIQDKGALIRRILGEVNFETTRGKYTFESDGFPENDIADMRRYLGDRVKS